VRFKVIAGAFAGEILTLENALLDDTGLTLILYKVTGGEKRRAYFDISNVVYV
jgi:hypothetical protein